MHCCLLHGRDPNFCDVLRAIGSVTTPVELALVALVLWLSAILDAVAFRTAVATLVVSQRRASLAFTLLLLIPRKGTSVFLVSWS